MTDLQGMLCFHVMISSFLWWSMTATATFTPRSRRWDWDLVDAMIFWIGLWLHLTKMRPTFADVQLAQEPNSQFALWIPGQRAERQLFNHHCEYLLLHFKSCCEEPFEQIWDQAQIVIPDPAVCLCVRDRENLCVCVFIDMQQCQNKGRYSLWQMQHKPEHLQAGARASSGGR